MYFLFFPPDIKSFYDAEFWQYLFFLTQGTEFGWNLAILFHRFLF